MKRCLFLGSIFQQTGDFPDLGLHSHIRHDKASTPVCDIASRKHHVGPISQRNFVFNDIFLLLHSKALPCECTFIDLEACIFQNSSVRRDIVPCLQHHEISHDKFPDRDRGDRAVTHDFRLRTRKFLQALQGLFRFQRLYRSEDRIDRNDHQNYNRTLHIS